MGVSDHNTLVYRGRSETHRRARVEAAGMRNLQRKPPETNTHGWENLGIIRKPAQVGSTGFSAGWELFGFCCVGILQGNLECSGIQSKNPSAQQPAKAPMSSCRWRKSCSFSPQGRLCRRDEKADSTLLDLPAASSLREEDFRLQGCQTVNFHSV